MYPLIETICVIDGVIQNLEWHQKRFETSYAKMYSKNSNIQLDKGLIIPDKFSTGVCKLRISYNAKSKKYEFENYFKRQIKSLKIVTTEHIDYELKYANRKHLNELVALKENCDDVLIIKNNRVTDSSYANIVFTDGQKWLTPTTPLLKGTCRARLLSENSIEAIDITTKDIWKFKGFNLINAMNDLDKNYFIAIENILK